MAAVAANSLPDPDKDRAASAAPRLNDVSAMFHRRVEFQAARKPYTGFKEQGNSGFKLVTLNPNSNPNLEYGSNSEPKKGGLAGSGKGSSEVALERGRNGLGLDPELSFSITFRRIGAGLQNLGNTCFLNSVLQCLTYTEPLAAYLQSGRHIASCRKSGFCALCAIQKHVRCALESSGRILAPKDLVSNLRCISRTFRNARQEDAHEYMVNLLESMHKCCLPSGMPSESPGAYEKSLVHKIFGGRLRSQVKCTQCSFCSDKFDPFLDLSLEIARADSLQKALAHFTAPEQLDGGEKHYQCQRCKQKVRALKQLSIDKPPEVLAVHLKRFGSHVPGQKIDRQIHFNPTLDLKPFVTGPYDGNVKYTLYGVLVHHGWSTHSGHYYCFVRTSSGMWYSLDDNRVVQVSEKRVLEQKAYMLFYVRDRTFSLSRKTADMLHKENVAMNASGRGVLSNCSQGLKGNMSNGTIEKKLNGSLSAEDAKKQAPKPPMFKDVQMKGDSHLKSSGPIAKVDVLCNGNGPKAQVDTHCNGNDPTAKVDSHKDCNLPSKEHSSEKQLKVSSAVGLGDALPVLKSNVEAFAVSSSKESGSVDLSNSANEASITSNGLEGSVIVQHDSDGFHTSVSKNEIASLVPLSDNNSKASAVKDVTSDRDGPSNSSGHQDISSLNKTGAEKVGSSNNTVLADSSFQKADGVNTEAKSSLPSKKSLDDKLHTVKVKPLKRLISARKLSKSIIFEAAFVRRKKRHRTESLMKVGENNSQSDFEPSTSEKSKASSVKNSKKRVKRGSNDKGKNHKILGKRRHAENDDPQNGCKNVTCDDIIVQNEKSAIGTGSSLTSDGKPSDAGKSGGSEHRQRDLVENGTRGLEETTVARWDGVEHPSAFVESRSGESLKIGYVGDDWDEEYDAGKRKKIRNSSIIFDGSNPFQDIATRKAKAKAKNGKVNRYCSANQPFRI